MRLKSLWNALIISPAVLGVMQICGGDAVANPLETNSLVPQSSSIAEMPDVGKGEINQASKQTHGKKLPTDLGASAKPKVTVHKRAIATISSPEQQSNTPEHLSLIATNGEIPLDRLREIESFKSHIHAQSQLKTETATEKQRLDKNLTTSHDKAVDKSSAKTTDHSSTKSIPPAKPARIADDSSTTDSLPLTSERDISEEANFNSSEDSADDGLDQVTDVSQLRDVQPGDWAYEALRELVEHYGCIAGYPDQTFRGRRAMSRYEFAAGVRACLQQIEKLIAAHTSDVVAKKDLAIVQRLNQEFGIEIAQLRGRVDGVEARISELEGHQFSMTTRFRGDVFFAAWSFFTGQNANGQKIPRETVYGARTRLSFSTSFFGNDLFFFRLKARNLSSVSGTSTFTSDGDLGFAGGTFTKANASKPLNLDTITYIFRPDKRTTVYVSVNGEIDDIVGNLNPLVGEGNLGSISNFGAGNPIYNLVGGAGAGVRHNLSKNFTFGYGYLANSANDPANPPQGGGGLFNGASGALAQFTVKPTKAFNFAFTYVNAYDNELGAGSNRANLSTVIGSTNIPLPSGIPASVTGGNLPVSVNSYGIESTWRIAPKFLINSWAGYTAERTLSSLGGKLQRGDLSILDYAVVLVFPDLGKLGSLGGILVGMEPRVTSVSGPLSHQITRDPNTSIHVEAFYQYRVTDYLAITPGIIWVTAPNFDNHNADIVYGVLRTRFAF